MDFSSGHIGDTGFSTVHHPLSQDAVVDIIFIHGFQGHPSATWTKPIKRTNETGASKKQTKGKWRNVVRSIVSRQPQSRAGRTYQGLDARTPDDSTGSSIFWPKDFLPEVCPNARIMTWGYDSHVTKGYEGAANKCSIFAHAKNLLFELKRERNIGQPIIFVAHSLGGIIVKEMLANSEASESQDHRDITESVAAIMFLGTPHRGTPDGANLGAIARAIADSLMIDTNPAVLDALGLRNDDLVRCQETFSKSWRNYDFCIKTFQEGTGQKGVNISILNEKLVPDTSSTLGDPREQAETLEGNHVEMCKIERRDDINYRKIAGEIKGWYTSIDRTSRTRAELPSTVPSGRNTSDFTGLTETEEACLSSLRFFNMNFREQEIHDPEESGSCQWLFDNSTYKSWAERDQDPQKFKPLLFINGKPGSGKSTLMKRAYRRMLTDYPEGRHMAAFFFNAAGQPEEKTSKGMFRSLLYQLLPLRREELRALSGFYKGNASYWAQNLPEDFCPLAEVELKAAFKSLLKNPSYAPAFIFIDGIDQCGKEKHRELISFFQEIVNGADTNAFPFPHFCISSTHFQAANIYTNPSLSVEAHNGVDIQRYVDRKLGAGDGSIPDQQWLSLKSLVVDNSAGLFLWVKLITDILLLERDEGKNFEFLRRRVSVVPTALCDRFKAILTYSFEEQEIALRFFQWVIFAQQPLRIREWYHILPLIHGERTRDRIGLARSLMEWHISPSFPENDEQVIRRIRSLSRGLVEVSDQRPDGRIEHGGGQNNEVDLASTFNSAVAGSMDSANGETRIVRVIHISVYDFFLQGQGFDAFPSSTNNHFGSGHFQIMKDCIEYIGFKELDRLVKERELASIGVRAGKVTKDSEFSFRDMLVSTDDSSDWLSSTNSSKLKLKIKRKRVKRKTKEISEAIRKRAGNKDPSSSIFVSKSSSLSNHKSSIANLRAIFGKTKVGGITEESRREEKSDKNVVTVGKYSREASSDESSVASFSSAGFGPGPSMLTIDNAKRAWKLVDFTGPWDGGGLWDGTEIMSAISAPSTTAKLFSQELEALNKSQKALVLERLSRMVEAPDHVQDMILLNQSTSPSENSLLSVKSRLLEALPALLHYVTQHLTTHLMLAKRSKIDVELTVLTLRLNGAWERWLALREDIPNDTDFLDYMREQDSRFK